MFLLVTGASGMGKSTVRRMLEPEFADVVETGEIYTLGVTPQWDIAWRHQMVERIVQLALEAQERGKHYLFAGDPVPPGEVWAAPSAHRLGRIAVCLLDASEEVQRARLLARGDDSSLLPNHVAFADWMRHHVEDPSYRPEVIQQNGWPEMRWDRPVKDETGSLPWSTHRIDTSGLSLTEVSARVATWLRQTIA